MSLTRTISAFNSAAASENKIHDDAVASKFGFTGGLVPGVDVFAYLAHAPAAHWGRDWLSQGGLRARFGKPVYDGDDATIVGNEVTDGVLALSISARGAHCASGTALRAIYGPAPAMLPAGAPVDRPTRPAASPETLKVGRVFAATSEPYTKELGVKHLANTREDASMFEDGAIANPAYLLRRANYILAGNVRLGPWIHSESEVRLHGLLRDGDTLETRGVVAENYEKGGHLIVSFDFTIGAGERLVMSGRHWAIYEPRQVRTAKSA
jgi:hypothetical protein